MVSESSSNQVIRTLKGAINKWTYNLQQVRSSLSKNSPCFNGTSGGPELPILHLFNLASRALTTPSIGLDCFAIFGRLLWDSKCKGLTYYDTLYGEVSFVTTETYDLDPCKLHWDVSVISHHFEGGPSSLVQRSRYSIFFFLLLDTITHFL